MVSREDWIGQRAYAIWEEEGRPYGRGDSHWRQAAEEYQELERTRASSDGGELVERLKRMGRIMRDEGSDRVSTARAPTKRSGRAQSRA